MMPYKRPAADKSGVPVYQPNATTYQQLMQLQQPFVPVSCEYSSSPTPTSASTSASPPTITAEPQLVTANASQLPTQITPNISKAESEAARPASTPAPIMPSLPPQTIPDPAAVAKEVAQQNYAKAVKLAAANQSLTNQSFANQSLVMNPLNALNYTGVALNKQAMNIPPPTFARYPPTALPLGLGTAGLGFGLSNPYAAATAMPNFLNIARQQAIINPYSLMRSPYTAATSNQQYLTPGLLGAQFPVSVASTQMTTVPPATNMTAAAVQSNNNNNDVGLPPYKKLKMT